MGKKVGLMSLNDPINTTTSHGRLAFNIFASFAEFERDVISERTHTGLSSARAGGSRRWQASRINKRSRGNSLRC